MRALLAISAKDLRQRLRDRSAFLIAVIAPFVLATIFSLIGDEITLQGRYLVVDADGGPVAAAFQDTAVARLSAEGLARSATVSSWDEARGAVDDGDADAAFLFPDGLSASVNGPRPGRIDVVVSDDESFETLLAGAVANRFASGVNAVRVNSATLAAAGRPGAASTAPPVGPVRSIDDAVELRQLDLTTYYVAGMAAFFVFFTVQFALLSFQSERRDGTLTRMLAAPVRPGAILAGKGLVALILALVSVAILVLASGPLLGAEWGPPLGVAMMVFSLSVAAVGVMAAATVAVRTYDQAYGLGTVVAVVLGLIGGAFFRVFRGPEFLSTLAVLSPHSWWLHGLGTLAPSDAAPADALPAATVLLAFGIAFGAIAAIRARRMLGS